ncbi:hypothetical protein C5S32_11810 [ANME-1 cluster archaeon GoMg1]|nr:hypothetical protein [ANME-1 cluster archaeon GoMg1]
MDTAKNIRASLKKLQGKIKSGKDISEEDLRVAFVKSGILEVLGYEGELKDVRFEKGVRGKRSDLLASDDYQNVVFVVEFKRPTEIDVERDFAQLWERYVKPLKARYGLLTDGLELLLYERINSNGERKLRVNLGEVALSQCEEVYDWLKKPEIKRTRIEAVLSYFERFDKPEERVNLSSEIAQQHFFDSFELKEESIFVNLIQKTIGLFDFELERSKFLKSAYKFWKISYAKKPEKVPENWRRIMDNIGLETTEENLFKFMFCLESAYSLFTRLILAKACEDYKLPDIDFSGFIKNQIRNISFRGDISLMAWAITTRDLIESMKQKLVKSVFEGDIFYWWEDSYKELSAGDSLYSPRYEKQKAYFGEALADIILTLYKFDFSEIVGDPLGTLYQRYFDKETRKALGEFYTPKEVVEYILDAVGYEGRSVIGKRLLDPACGSGTFLVEALRRYLKASEQVVEEKGWSGILKELCNEYCIAGFDIHPFATFMAQMQFMLVLIPAYKKAMDEDPHFVLNRLPIFRTDSLVDETKGEARKVTIEESARGIRHILIDTCLPVDGGNLKIKMPYDKDVFARTDLLNVQEYFAALQAVFDTVKKSAWQEKYAVDNENLERNFKLYLDDKEWSVLVSFFTPYAEHFLQKFEELKATFGDGKLIKSIEDIMLAAILKNYVKYDFVVGNPPYVRTSRIGEKEIYRDTYEELAVGQYDISYLFVGRGIKWLNTNRKLGYITSNKFCVLDSGVGLRGYILNNAQFEQFIDFSGIQTFTSSLPASAIMIMRNTQVTSREPIKVDIKIQTDIPLELENIDSLEKSLGYLLNHLDFYMVSQSRFFENEEQIFDFSLPDKLLPLVEKVERASKELVPSVVFDIRRGLRPDTSKFKDKFFISAMEYKALNVTKKSFYKKHIRGKDIVDKYKILWSGEYVKFEPEKMAEGKDKELYESPKIVIKRIGKKLRVVYDKHDYYCYKTIHIIRKDDSKIDLALLTPILNSKLIEFYFITKFYLTRLGRGSFEFREQFLKHLPIKLPQTPEEQDLANEITKKVEQINEKVKLEQKKENFPNEYIQGYRNRGEEFDLLPLSFNSNHKVIEPVIEKNITGRGYNIIIGKKEKSVFVESKVKANYVVTALKGKNAKKDEKKQILIPKSDAIVEEVLKKLEKDNAKVKSPSVAELEEEINELVYKLYGLNEKDIKVIEDFLRRF